MNTTNIADIMRSLQVSRETAREIAEHRAIQNRELASEWKKNLPSLKIRCDEAYEAELRRYLAKNPAGKNGEKAALRKARAIWSGYRR